MIYINGSLKDPMVPTVSRILRARGYEVFDDWHASGPKADEHWRAHEMGKGLSYREALLSTFARHVFDYDKTHMHRCCTAIAIGKPNQLPGRSGLMELTYMRWEMRASTYVLLNGNPDDWDQMLPLACPVSNILHGIEDLEAAFPDISLKAKANF